jgi:galactose-1-phosphate uridylyltransferase
MASETPLIENLPDGTLRHFHPVTEREVRNVLGRTFRPNRARKDAPPPQPLNGTRHRTTCDFCSARRLETPPEKTRWFKDASGSWVSRSFIPPSEVLEGPCDFRRIANLYEIVPYDTWVKCHGFQPTDDRRAWREAYLSDPTGTKHIETLARHKLRKAGWDAERLAALDRATAHRLTEGLFFGSHDLIVSDPHYRPDARMDNEVLGSGDMDPDHHHHYLLAATETAKDILDHNPLARYVAVFQNYLAPSGASFEHLHKQVVGMDVPGPYPTALLKSAREIPDLFQRRFLEPSLSRGWVIAGNAHALAVAAFGVEYPSVWVFSRSRASRPWELSTEEMRGFSDILQACHAATGSDIATNEEWNYAPLGEPGLIPFHVTLKWRVNVHAGFEGVSGVIISPLGPNEVRDRMVERLRVLQAEGRLGDVNIAPTTVEPLPRL